MATVTVPSETRRKQVVVGGTPQTSFTFPFVIFDTATDIRLLNGSTELNIGSDFTVAGNAGTDGGFDGGTITMAGSFSSGLSNTTVTILGNTSRSRLTNFSNTGPLVIDLLNKDLNRYITLFQQIDDFQNRTAALAEETTVTLPFVFPAPDANKVIAWNSGATALEAAQSVGLFRGNWAASTAYKIRDFVKDTSTGNIFIANTDHTSSGAQPLTSNTDAAKWDLLVDAASATTSQTAAATSATAAATSATAAATSATAAATSATTATTQASTSTTKAGEAATSATNAATSATGAASSATSATSSATSATSSASTATTKASEASTSATNAAASATAAASSATAAASSASGASTSATNAAASANAAEAAAAAIFFEFETSTTMGNPSAGGVRFNNASVGSVTQICFSATSASSGNPDISDFIVTWDDSTSPVKGHLIIRESGAPGSSIVFSVTGTITDNTTHLIVPVSHVSSAGVSLSASDDLFFSFSRTGNAGAGAGDLLASNNLSDLGNSGTSRTNLGVAIGSDVQAHDADLDAIAALAKTDGNIIVGNGSTWVAESGATARTSLGVDAAGTDNSTAVTLAGSLDYITISGQELTRNAIDLAADVTGTLPAANGGTGTTSLGTGTLLTSGTHVALTAGFSTDIEDMGSSGTGTETVDLQLEGLKTLTINGNFTLAPDASRNGIAVILSTNSGGGHSMTTSGWDHVIGEFDNTASKKHLLTCYSFAATDVLRIEALS